MIALRINTRRLLSAIFCSGLLLLPGCADNEQAARLALEAVQNAVDAVKDSGDPWRSFEVIDNTLQTAVCGRPQCPEVQAAIDKAVSIGTPLLKRAIQERNPDALLYLFSDRNFNYQGLRQFGTPYLLQYADLATGSIPQDKAMLMIAAKIIAEGKDVIRDTSRAVDYYARAWSMGSSDAPRLIYDIFMTSNDRRNAYLWSLRCMKNCRSANDVSQPESELSPAAIAKIKQLSSDTSIIRLE